MVVEISGEVTEEDELAAVLKEKEEWYELEVYDEKTGKWKLKGIYNSFLQMMSYASRALKGKKVRYRRIDQEEWTETYP